MAILLCAATTALHGCDRGNACPPAVVVTELPYGEGEGLTERLPLRYASSAKLKQDVALADARELVVSVLAGTEVRTEHIAGSCVQIDATLNRRIAGYVGKEEAPLDFQWRGRTPAEVAFVVEHIGGSLVLTSAEWSGLHEIVKLKDLVVRVPPDVAVVFRPHHAKRPRVAADDASR